MQKVGIDAVSFYIPSLYLKIENLAKERGLDPLKLEKGLGLNKMSILDYNEDAATLAAEALSKLISDYNINPKEISRIYLGTESALDAAKPTATLALQMVEDALIYKFGERIFENCDALDMTFACIGGVDALQNALDYVRVNPHKKAIVIAADYAKYELASSGEYTQGGGAVAILVTANPRLLQIDNNFGVGLKSVFDFFKPRRHFTKSDLSNCPATYPDEIEIFSDEPVFDGHYSNNCFKDRIKEAYFNFKKEKNSPEHKTGDWHSLIFHLPYAFHGKRIFTEIFGIENNLQHQTSEDLKLISDSTDYKKLVATKIEPSQRASSEIGNMYTASIFMALISTMQVAYDNKENLVGETFGFFAYGSGSKAKVFEAKVSEDWKSIVEKWNVFDVLSHRQEINFETYEKLHRKQIKSSVIKGKKGFVLDYVESENPVLIGARYYKLM